MGLMGQMLAGGIAGGADSLVDSMKRQEVFDQQNQLERARQLHSEHLAELQHRFRQEDFQTERTAKQEDAVVGVDDNGLPVYQRDLAQGKTAMNPKQWEKNLPLSAAEKEEQTAKVGLLNAQTEQAKAHADYYKAGGDRRVDLSDAEKTYNGLLRMGTPPEEAKRIVIDKLKGTGLKESVHFNDDGTLSVYDPESRSARQVYTPDQAREEALRRVEEESQQAGKGLFNLEWDDAKKMQRAREIEAELLEGSRSSKKGGSGVTDNNVGNMRPPGKSEGFQQFGSVEEGLAAIDKQLKIYSERDGLNTVRGIVSKWAPSNENNTEALIKAMSARTGFKSDDKLDMSNPATRMIISSAIAIQEKGPGAFLANRKTAEQPTAEGGQGLMGGGGVGKKSAAAEAPKKPIDLSQFDTARKGKVPATRPTASTSESGAVDLIPSMIDESTLGTQNTSPSEAVGRFAGILSNTAEKAGDTMLAARDAGENLGKSEWWGKQVQNLSTMGRQMLEAVKKNGIPEEEIAQEVLDSGRSIEQVLGSIVNASGSFKKGYESTRKKS